MMEDNFEQYLETEISTLRKLNKAHLLAAAEAMIETYQAGGTIYFFGNGGSGATASHIAGDFLKGVSYGLEKRFKTICLNDNPASMMAIANDISYDDIFIEPLKNYMQKGDLVIGISGSGNSNNVVKAMEYAKIKGVKTLAFCGYKGGKIKELADLHVHAEVMDMEITEDIHMVAFHMIKQYIIKKLSPDNKSMGSVYDQRVS